MSGDSFDRFQDRDRGRFGDNETAPAHPRPRVTGASDLVDLTVALHHETERAVLVSLTGDEAGAVWLPKVACEIERKNSYLPGRRRNGRPVTLACAVLTLPEWKAKEAGLV